MNETTDFLVFGVVVALRFLVPLLIPKYPLPAVVACLIIDGVDQTIFQTFTNQNLDGYQSYDKALDIYYLAIAYLSTMRNWENLVAFELSRFLYYYRLVGVVLFEATHLRATLLFFPNTFEYFFIFYEAVRLRWNPVRMAAAVVIGIGAAIWFVVKIPQEYWIHIAQLDVTDELAAHPELVPLLAASALVLLGGVWYFVTKRLPDADHGLRFSVDDPFSDQLYRNVSRVGTRRRILDLALLEKVVMTSLISGIFAQILPDLNATAVQIAVWVGVLVVLNTVVSELLSRRGFGPETMLKEFVAMAGINVGLLVGARWLLSNGDSRIQEGATLFFLLLVTLLITLYDRYQAYYLIRAGLRDGSIVLPSLRNGSGSLTAWARLPDPLHDFRTNSNGWRNATPRWSAGPPAGDQHRPG